MALLSLTPPSASHAAVPRSGTVSAYGLGEASGEYYAPASLETVTGGLCGGTEADWHFHRSPQRP